MSIISILVMVFVLAFVSATVTVSSVSELDKDASGSFIFSVSSDQNESISISLAEVVNVDDATKKITFVTNETLPFNILVNETISVLVNYTIASEFEFSFEDDYSTNLNVNGNVSDEVVKVIPFEVNTDFCGDCDNRGRLDINTIEYRIEEGFGDDDDKKFYPMDVMRADFIVENKGTYDIDNVKIELCVYDTVSEKCVFDEDDFNLSDDDLSVDSSDEMDVEAFLNIDATELKGGHTSYKLYISAKGKIDDSDSSYNNEYTGISTFDTLEIVTDDEFFLVDNFQVLTSSTVNCGESVTVGIDLWNIDDNSVDADEIFLNVYSDDFDFDEVITFDSRIKSMDFEPVEFTFDVPNGLEEGKDYKITFSVFRDESLASKYLYDNAEEDDATYTYDVEVVDGCSVMSPSINAKLASEAMIGEDMEVTIHVTNPDNEAITYVVGLDGYNNDKAEFLDFSVSAITVQPGQTGLFDIRFNPIEEGEFTFDVSLTSELGESYSQPVVVTIKPKEMFSFDFKNNTVLYVLAGILVLFIVFLFVLIAVISKKRKTTI